MNEKLKRYAREYIDDEGHWYISKVKQFTEESINDMAKGLHLFHQLLSTKPNKLLKLRYQSFCKTQQQAALFKNIAPKRIMVVDSSMFFLSLEILRLGLVDLQQMKRKNSKKYNIVLQIIHDFEEDKDYSYFINKHSNKFLKNDIAIYFRNYKSWLSKFGFFGVYKNNSFFETEAGKAFRNSHHKPALSNAIFLNQIKKLQVWNPTIDKKYQNIKTSKLYLIILFYKC